MIKHVLLNYKGISTLCNIREECVLSCYNTLFSTVSGRSQGATHI